MNNINPAYIALALCAAPFIISSVIMLIGFLAEHVKEPRQ